MKNIDKGNFILHTKYLAGPMGTDFINILLPIGAIFYNGNSKFIVKYHEFTQAISELTSVINAPEELIEENNHKWTIEIVAYEIENTGDIYTQMWRQSMLGKLEI